jgi:prophage DNA circulation protein
LIHPVEGRLENMVARPGWSFSEAVDEDGVGRFVATFERSDVETAPTAVVGASVAAIDAARDATSSAVEATLAEMNISPGFVGNVSAAIEKVGAIKEGIEDAVGSLTIVVDQLNEWQATVTQFGDDIASLVAAPQDLALAAVGLFDSMTGLYAGVAGAARGTWDMFSSLFSFGDEDAEIVPTTSGLAERLATQSTLNSGVQVMALAHAYAAAMAMDFDTVPEITEVQSAMEAQYQKVYLSGLLDTDVLAQLTTLRRLLQEYLDARKLTASQLVTITTPATSARLLAFKWYGDTERGAEIAALNGVEDPAFVEGAVEIFTVWRP